MRVIVKMEGACPRCGNRMRVSSTKTPKKRCSKCKLAVRRNLQAQLKDIAKGVSEHLSTKVTPK